MLLFSFMETFTHCLLLNKRNTSKSSSHLLLIIERKYLKPQVMKLQILQDRAHHFSAYVEFISIFFLLLEILL